MLRRLVSLLALGWVLGFLMFAVLLPRPAPADAARVDVVVVLTGGEGRIDRGLDVLRQHWAARMLVAGVDPEVKPAEFAAHYHIAPTLMACCITLGFESVDTRSNAQEAARWVAASGAHSVRLVTSDWHMRRAALELDHALPRGVLLLDDAVPTQPSLHILFIEYNKLLARWLLKAWRG